MFSWSEVENKKGWLRYKNIDPRTACQSINYQGLQAGQAVQWSSCSLTLLAECPCINMDTICIAWIRKPMIWYGSNMYSMNTKAHDMVIFYHLRQDVVAQLFCIHSQCTSIDIPNLDKTYDNFPYLFVHLYLRNSSTTARRYNIIFVHPSRMSRSLLTPSQLHVCCLGKTYWYIELRGKYIFGPSTF
jgi:hypothetical protein